MATRLYLRNLTPTDSPGETERSAVLPVVGGRDAGIAIKALNTAKGAAQVSITYNSFANADHNDDFFTSFSSDALAAGDVTAQTWSLGIAFSEGNAAANSGLVISLYVFRPSSSSVVGYVRDSDSQLGPEWGATEDGIVASFAGSAVSGVQDGDILVLEVWRHTNAQSMSVAYAQTCYFEGTTDVVDATTTNAASYIETPQTLAFFTPPAAGLPPNSLMMTGAGV